MFDQGAETLSKMWSNKLKEGSDGLGANLIGVVELVVHEAGDDAGLAHGLVPQEHQLVLC